MSRDELFNPQPAPLFSKSSTCAEFFNPAAKCKGEHEFRSLTFTWHLEKRKLLIRLDENQFWRTRIDTLKVCKTFRLSMILPKLEGFLIVR